MNKYKLYTLVISIFVLSACSEDKLQDSILTYSPPQQNELDVWLESNVRSQYNIGINYRWEDIESDLTYNLVPADFDKSFQLAKYIKYLWLDAYDELTGDKDFMSTYAPKLLQFVGSAAINPSTNTETLGTAEGGLKITLYKVNSIDINNPDLEFLNEYFFKTMHHEFAHILHQTKNYPKSFDDISSQYYSSTGWQNRTSSEAWSLGFVTNYASKAPEEDFVEIIANYVTKGEDWWESMLKNPVTDKDVIEKKFDIVQEWLKNSWDIDINELRDIVMRRSSEINSI